MVDRFKYNTYFKLHDKIFVAWNILRVLISVAIRFVFQMQTNIYVKIIRLVCQGLCLFCYDNLV